jgi:carbamoyl-phosphate synthase large subunit
MNRRIHSVLVLGSAAIKIGEAGEFDYSGSQAIKAFREEGITVVLVNPNIATVQTTEHAGTKIYLLPVTPEAVTSVIIKERPEAIVLGFGGQTALNCGLELARDGTLDKYGVTVLGTPVSAIESTEDRQLFADTLRAIDVPTPRSLSASTIDEALIAAQQLSYPVMVRAAFALGGLGSGKCANTQELHEVCRKAFSFAPQVLIEEYLCGWKEIEYEMVRDCADNCIAVCNMENFDPLGIHTGESIVVAPSQTLSNLEYHKLRTIAQRVVRHLGIIGECNIQFALAPTSDHYRVIEVNARLSRSSALASKATGYPLAFVAAKLALGYTLVDVKNQVTQSTVACFEPALDYVVVKVPRWDLKKFANVSRRISSEMKSVGEVMAIGRKFEEALQKALRMSGIGALGLVGNKHLQFDDIDKELSNPTDERIFAIVAALEAGCDVDFIQQLTHIDEWFLHKIANVCTLATRLREYEGGPCPPGILREAKKSGFSDRQVASYIGSDEFAVRRQRQQHGIAPVVKQIDTMAAEYPAHTNYLYLTYNGQTDDVHFTPGQAVLVLGSGVYRIGSSVEFDWCCVNTVRTLKQMGRTTILLNCNPETVSTDYDECDRLYFDEISLETVHELCAMEQPHGVIVSMGGQTSNDLALKLDRAGVPILGTPPEKIDCAENRSKFSSLLDNLGISQPVWSQFLSVSEARIFAAKVGYPVLVRPSYILSGQAMGVAANESDLDHFLRRAATVSPEHPVVLSKFIENAEELECDGVAQQGQLLTSVISEHIEFAGVHSGDATLVLPPQHSSLETIRRVQSLTRKIVDALRVTGPFNIQFLARGHDVQVIECNLRASRSVPFVSKVLGTNLADLATKAMVIGGQQPCKRLFTDLEYVGVKAPQFSFSRLHGADPVLRVEMRSTGEVGCLGGDFSEALLKAMLSVGYRLPVDSVLLSSGPVDIKVEFISSARMLQDAGIHLFATPGTASFMHQYGVSATIVQWPLCSEPPNVLDLLTRRQVQLVVNIPKNDELEERANDYIIRRKAVDCNIPLITDLRLAKRFVEALVRRRESKMEIRSLEEYTRASAWSVAQGIATHEVANDGLHRRAG